MKIRLIQFSIIIGLLLLFETISYFSLPSKNRTRGFFINPKLIRTQGSYVHINEFGFDQIDPLLGWSRTNSSLTKTGFKVENNCVLLKGMIKDNQQPIKIFITGGSTTDLALNHENWPKYLHQVLDDHGISADIYVGAMGGYNSGQEVLKLMQDGVEIKPDIHISYSGANEVSSYYVSYYESDLFENILNSANSSVFLPNTIYVLKNALGLNSKNLVLKGYPDVGTSQSFSFWKKNMTIMSGVATANNYKFIGILQPVLGIGTHSQPKELKDYEGNITAYKDYYPRAIDFSNLNSSYLYNMTMVFDSVNDKTYVDDCHLTDKYQPFIAQKIFDILIQRKLVTKRAPNYK